MSSYFVTFSMEKFSLVVEEEKISTKNNERWKTFIHKNEHEMVSITSHVSTYFPTSYQNQVFLFSFFMLLSNGPLVYKVDITLFKSLFYFLCWILAYSYMVKELMTYRKEKIE